MNTLGFDFDSVDFNNSLESLGPTEELFGMLPNFGGEMNILKRHPSDGGDVGESFVAPLQVLAPATPR